MANTRISNRFYVTAIEDGSNISAALMCDKSLSQGYNKVDHTFVEDWSDPNEHRLIYAVVRKNGELVSANTNDVKWYYNNQEINFSGNTKFVKTTRTVAGITTPALQIIDNLADLGNTDQDTITLKGKIELNGYDVEYSVNILVRISEMSSSGYFGVIEGDAYVYNPTDVASMTAELYNGSTKVNNFKTIWVREGIDEPDVDPDDGWPKTVTTTTGKAAASITAEEVLDYVVIRVDYYVDNVKVYSAFWDVDDLQDTEEMYITYGANNGKSASLRKDEKVTFKIWMGNRTNQYQVDDRFIYFFCKMLNSAGETAKCVIDSAKTDNTLKQGTSSSPDYVDITKTNEPINPSDSSVKAAKAGVVTIEYDFATALGSTITGVVVASSFNINS